MSEKPIFGEEINKETETRYRKDRKVGEGTYAVVYFGHDNETGRKVAIKKIKVGEMRNGLDISAIREVKALRELRHPNVIELVDVFSHKRNLNLVLEYLETDLELLIKDKNLVFMAADIKSWMLMAMRGLNHCHQSWILHRDMKPNNLLISSSGELKLADFGLARPFGDATLAMTSQTVTRWYRAPELLYGSKYYTGAVDIWAMGCIFAELMLRTPYLPGESDLDQLNTTFRALGTPTEDEWPGMTQLPDFVEMKKYPKAQLNLLFTAASPNALDLLGRMLCYNPSKRITTYEALGHPYFADLPAPTRPENLPKITKPIAETEEEKELRKRKIAEAFSHSSLDLSPSSSKKLVF